jgi:Ser/Thr protein kinase RdoA (MazF antagonist)
LLSYLKQQNLPVSVPLLTSQNNYHVYFAGKYYSLYPYIPGQILHEPLPTAAIHHAALVLAKIHKLMIRPTIPLPDAKPPQLSQAEHAIKAAHLLHFTKQNSLGAELDQIVTQLIRMKLATYHHLKSHDLALSSSIQGFTHGDFHNQNLIFTPKHNLAAVLDFEAAHYGYQLTDLIKFIRLACCNRGFNPANLAKAQQFVTSYTSLRPLTDADITAGFNHMLLDFCGRFELETQLYREKSLFLVQYLIRDLRALKYFTAQQNQLLAQMVSSASQG